MKNIFLAVVVAAFSLAFTACGDSPEKLVDDMVRDAVKCGTHELDKTECDKLDTEYKVRKASFPKEEQKWIEKEALGKFLLEINRIDDEKRARL
jgi:hypothetical protein